MARSIRGAGFTRSKHALQLRASSASTICRAVYLARATCDIISGRLRMRGLAITTATSRVVICSPRLYVLSLRFIIPQAESWDWEHQHMRTTAETMFGSTRICSTPLTLALRVEGQDFLFANAPRKKKDYGSSNPRCPIFGRKP